MIVQLFLGITRCGNNVFSGINDIILDSFVIIREVYYEVGNLLEIDQGPGMVRKCIILH